jgi:hypothetical protein
MATLRHAFARDLPPHLVAADVVSGLLRLERTVHELAANPHGD